jgi:hypothetical protein
MAIQTYVENGDLVGYLPRVGATIRVPLREIAQDAGLRMQEDMLRALDRASGDTLADAIAGLEGEIVGAGKVAKKIKKAVKKVAQSKVVKGLVSVVKKAVPPPFSVAIGAAEGAAKFAKSLKGGSAKHKKVVKAVQQAAAGKITSKQLEAVAKKAGVSPAEASDAAVIKRVAMEAPTNPQAAATLKLAADLTSTEPAQQALAAASVMQAETPGSLAFVVQAPGGAMYRTLVQTGT